MAIVALSLIACACAHATHQQLQRRAAFDLDCAEDQIEIVELDDRTRGVRGCGKKAVYIEDCRQGYSVQGNAGQVQAGTYDKDCTWVLNADTTQTER